MGTTTNTPLFLRRRLGRRLRELREAAGLNLDQAAVRLDRARSSLHRVESGANKPDVHLIRSMMDLYDHYEPGLLEQAREAAKPPWFRAFGVEDFGYLDMETYADRVREFGGLTVPGLLQTEAYIRAVLERSRRRRRRTVAQIEQDVAVRLIRQERLTSAGQPLELVAVIDEAALRREVGGPKVLRGQVRHLVEVAALQAVTLQVLALRRGAHSGMDGAFTLLDFRERDGLELLYVEHSAGALHIEDTERVRAATLAFDQLRAEALSPTETVAFLERVAGELGRR